MSAFTDAIARNMGGLHVAPSAAPGCPKCLDVPVRTCDRPECYTDTPCVECNDGANEPDDNWHDLANEPSFSWSACDTCGSHLGGDRHAAHAFADNKPSAANLIHLEICTDCLIFFANGDEPEEWEG